MQPSTLKLLKCSFKLPFILSTITLDFLKQVVVPGQKLMIWLFIVFILDFITGIIKAYIIKDPITSKKMRESVGKMLQYAGMIILVMILANASLEVANASFVIDGIYMLAILIETRSIAENFKAMSPDSTITLLILNPLLLIFDRQTKVLQNNVSPKEDTDQQAPEPIKPDIVSKLVVFLVVLLPFASCNTVNKHKTSHLAITANHNKSRSDSSHYKNASIGMQLAADSVFTVNKTTQHKKELTIAFATDTAANREPITVEHSNGKIVINPGGRNVTMVDLQSDSSAAASDSMHVLNESVAFSKTFDSSNFRKTASSDSTATVQEMQFVKSTKRFVAVAFGGLFILILLAAFGIYYVRKNNLLLKSQQS